MSTKKAVVLKWPYYNFWTNPIVDVHERTCKGKTLALQMILGNKRVCNKLIVKFVLLTGVQNWNNKLRCPLIVKIVLSNAQFSECAQLMISNVPCCAWCLEYNICYDWLFKIFIIFRFWHRIWRDLVVISIFWKTHIHTIIRKLIFLQLIFCELYLHVWRRVCWFSNH